LYETELTLLSLFYFIELIVLFFFMLECFVTVCDGHGSVLVNLTRRGMITSESEFLLTVDSEKQANDCDL
jgi:hypothetical protein